MVNNRIGSRVSGILNIIMYSSLSFVDAYLNHLNVLEIVKLLYALSSTMIFWRFPGHFLLVLQLNKLLHFKEAIERRRIEFAIFKMFRPRPVARKTSYTEWFVNARRYNPSFDGPIRVRQTHLFIVFYCLLTKKVRKILTHKIYVKGDGSHIILNVNCKYVYIISMTKT